ncbi:MAG: NAD-dependent epimerase/dehydratase family protein, partial [Mangrovicoccus sp.]
MARILVTGATGLIGRAAVAALLEKDCEVIALSRREPLDLPGISPVICDVTDPVAVDQVLRNTQVETLLHLAWLTGAERWHGAENLDWVGHSLHLVRSFAEAGGRRVVGAGSCAEYDWTDGGVLSETSPLRPATAYGAAKAATGLALCGCAKALGLSLAWARIFFVFGPGEPRGRLFGDLI